MAIGYFPPQIPLMPSEAAPSPSAAARKAKRDGGTPKPRRPIGSAPAREPYTPPFQHWVALGFMCLFIFILSLPMWSGQFLAGPHSDQYSTGWAIRHWGAEQWRLTGRLPLWDPERMSGVVVVAGFGDLFYPTAWLRLIMGTSIAFDLGMVAHYVLAGFFLYLLLRMLGTSWLGAVVGGLGYQLSGVIVSYASPGHDGKLFVTALFPLMLIGLVLGIRQKRLWGFGVLALAVGLALLSPQYQTTQYSLLACAIFALYLTFGEPSDESTQERVVGLAWATVGVALGFALSMIQVLPFFHYIPFSPRAGTLLPAPGEPGTYEWSTSYGTPLIHIPEFFLSGFTGHYPEMYWGPNGSKLHSEYLGLPLIALAVMGVGGDRKRLTRWILGIGILFLLVAFGGDTPFYRLWYAVVPYVKKTRAPGIAFFLVAFATSVLAALGVERVERGDQKTHQWAMVSLIAGVLIVLLAVSGVLGSIPRSYVDAAFAGVQGGWYELKVRAADDIQSSLRWGAVGSAFGLIVLAALVLGFLRDNVPAKPFAFLLALLIGADLWRAGAPFWSWSRPEQQQVATDDLTRQLNRIPLPYRVYDPQRVYSKDALMAFNIPEVTGYHGNQLQTYLDLIGGEDEQTNLARSPNLWKLLDIGYWVLHDTISLPGYRRVAGPFVTGLGQTGYLYQADTMPLYARVVSGAAKADTSQIVPTLLDPRLDYNRVVLFSPDQPVNPPPMKEMPPPSPSKATVASWAPGKMTITMNPPPPAPSYLLVSENWYKDWTASVDGKPTTVLRGDETLITVPVPAGAKSVDLAFVAKDYETGKRITQVALLAIIGLIVIPLFLNRRAGPAETEAAA